MRKVWKAHHVTLRVLKKGSRNKKSLAYTSLQGPVLEYGASFWDLYRKCQVNALDLVQKKAAKFASHTNVSVWGTLAQRRMISHICVHFKSYTGERAWKVTGDRLQGSCHLNRDMI